MGGVDRARGVITAGLRRQKCHSPFSCVAQRSHGHYGRWERWC